NDRCTSNQPPRWLLPMVEGPDACGFHVEYEWSKYQRRQHQHHPTPRTIQEGGILLRPEDEEQEKAVQEQI
ncbi:hypothetical protein BGX30_007006, partial [Mortierella sp. GBA39]